jgi:hypothetical protein
MWRMLLFAACFMFVSNARAQEFNHVEVGAFGEYYNSNQTDTNFAGVGGRVGVPILPHTNLEAEMSYDFNQVFTEGFSNTSGGSIAFANSNQRVLHGLVGPKLNLGHGAFHPFLELKGGFINYSFSSRPASFDTFVSSVQNLRSQNWNAALMPAAGLEGRIGPVGLRLDAGDEMYFNHGAHHNAKVAFGPFIRF